MQTIKQVLNQNITIFEKDIDYKIANPGFEKNIVYEGIADASPLRQLITFIKFVSNTVSPHIVIQNINSNIFVYNDEFTKFINYLLMSGIPLHFYIPARSNISAILKFNTSVFTDNLFIHNSMVDMEYWGQKLVNNLYYNKKNSIDINNLIFVADEHSNKVLVLSKNFILLSFESTLLESIYYLKLMQQ